MVLRIAFFFMMALGLIGFGTVAWISTRPPPSAKTAVAAQPTTMTVLTAARPVHAGELLKPEDIGTKVMPVNDPTAATAMHDAPDARGLLVGSMVRRSLSAGDLLRDSDLMRPGDHGFLAAVLEPGMRAMTLAVDNTTGSAGLIWPGDRVDLILTQSIQDTSLPLGHRVAAETVLSNARVIAIDQQIIQGAAPTSSDSSQRTVTLEVTEEAAQRISVAIRLGRLSLSVRSAEKSQVAAQASSSPQMTWAADVSPALGAATAPATTDSVVRVFQGAGDVKEFKY
jgi:pilus assembly protein CpaB